jgi:AcrR family transcriptional regulator
VAAPLPEREELTAKQEPLVRAAYAVLSEHGVDRMSLQDVADAADVSKGLVLYHFKSKENLVLTTMRWVLTRVAERIRASLEEATTPEEQVAAMIAAIFVGPEANRRFYLAYLELLDHAARFEPFSQLHATFHTIVNGLYAQVVAAGVEAGEFTVEDVDEAATVIRGLIDGLFLQWLQERDWRRSHPRYQETCRRAALTYLQAASVPATAT